MDYTQLAPEPLMKKRKIHKKRESEKMKEILNEQEDGDWIHYAVECTNCGANSCKYRPKKKLVFESTKSAVFGSASRKQDVVDMLCSDAVMPLNTRFASTEK